ncbi:MAG TPA: calcium-binding protein, partial [Devosiaceae bacterium]|nr:calcium-binding protein [Devosiaceae bacterium]
VHYALWGWLEGRDPSAFFDTDSYLFAYPDVDAAGINPLEHYLHFGAAEGRLAFADGVFN